MAERLIQDGPDEMWSEDRPASRGQLRAIAVLACELLGLPEPTTRLAATQNLTALRLYKRDHFTGEPDRSREDVPFG